MALYKTHTKFNLIFALPLFIILGKKGLVQPNEELILFTSSFIYGTLFLNPDLDLAHKIKFFSLRGLFTLPFRLYSLFFKHRGISHSPIFGTFSRLVFIALLMLLVGFFSNKIFDLNTHFLQYFQTHKMVFYAIFAGLFLADLSHLFLDLIYKFKMK